MTSSNNEGASGGHLETPDYGKVAKKAVNNAMYDMYWLWGSDDKHPGIELMRKASTISNPSNNLINTPKSAIADFGIGDYSKQLESTGIFPDFSKSGNAGLTSNFQDFSPLSSKNDNAGLLSNFTEKKPSLASQVGHSIAEGVNADGQRTTDAYYKHIPAPNPQPVRTNEALYEARKSTGDILSPPKGDIPARQGLSSIASRKNNLGMEYLPAMQGYLENARTDGIRSSNEAETDFTWQIAKKTMEPVVDAYDRHYEDTAFSIDGAETPYQKLYPEQQDEYEAFLQKLIEPGAHAYEGVEEHGWINDADRERSEKWEIGRNVASLKYVGIASSQLAAMNAILPKKDLLITNPAAFDESIKEGNRKSRELKRQLTSLTHVWNAEDPVERYNHVLNLCYETFLGEYVAETAIAIATWGRGVPEVGMVVRSAKLMNMFANDYYNSDEKDEIRQENIRHNSKLRFGQDESEEHARLNSIADAYNPSVATSLKLYFKIIPQPMREDHLDIYDSLKRDWK